MTSHWEIANKNKGLYNKYDQKKPYKKPDIQESTYG